MPATHPPTDPVFAPDFRPDIAITEVHYLGGPNRWTYRPVLEAVVDIGALEDFPSNRIPGLRDRLSGWLPGLIEHRCSHGVRGGFLRRLDEGTWPAHILEHVALELQTLAGVPTGFGRARETSRRGVYRVIIRAFDEQTARAALVEARALVLAAMLDHPFDVERAVARLRACFAAHGPGAGPTSAMLAAEARRIPYIRLDDGDLVQIGHGSRQRRIRAAETDATSAIADGISRDEDLTRELLQACGVPVSNGDPAAGTAESRPGHTPSRIRLLVIGTRVVAATRPGQTTEWQSAAIDRLPHEMAAMAVLATRVIGLDIADVELAIEDLPPPREQRAAVVAVRANPDLSRYLDGTGPMAQTIGEAILARLFPQGANGRIPVIGVAGGGETAHIARNICWLLRGDDTRESGQRVGLASTEGIFLDGRRIADGNGSDRDAATRLLASPLVDAAVIENGLHVMATQGLAYDRCSVGVVTALAEAARSEDFDITTEEQVRTVLRTQVDVVLPTGAAVLDAGDERVADLASLCDGETMLYCTSAAGNRRIDEHLAAGGRAVCIENGFLTLCAGAVRTAIAPAQAAAVQPVSAWIPAVAAAWASGMTQAQLAARFTLPSAPVTGTAAPAGKVSIATVD